MNIEDLKIQKYTLETALRKVKREIKTLTEPPKQRKAFKIHAPLKRDSKTDYEGRVWSKRVFELNGNACFWCGGPANQACHIIGKGMKLGKQRYCTPVNGVPGCGPCHEKQTRNELRFTLDVRQVATRALNLYLKRRLPIPQE